MANPEHVAKLKEGVEAWNKWRAENPEVIPDFRGGLGEVLSNDAVLDGYEIFGGMLAQLSTDAAGANLDRVDIRTVFNPNILPIPNDKLIENSLGDVVGRETMLVPVALDTFGNLTQHQVNKMRGDRFTKLPDDLTMPDHWVSEPVNGMDDVPEQTENPAPIVAPSAALKTHMAFILKSANAAASGAELAANQIEQLCTETLKAEGINGSDETDLFFEVSATLRIVASEIEKSQKGEVDRAALEATIETQRLEIERLTKLLADRPSAKSQIAIAALGAAGGTAISNVGFLFGPEAAAIIDNIWAFIGPSTTAPPTSPDIG